MVTDTPKKCFWLCVCTRSAQGGEQRQQMLVGGVCVLASCLLAVVEQCVHIALDHVGVNPVGKLMHIRWRGTALHAHHHEVTQVVRHIARADDQDVLLGQ